MSDKPPKVGWTCPALDDLTRRLKRRGCPDLLPLVEAVRADNEALRAYAAWWEARERREGLRHGAANTGPGVDLTAAAAAEALLRLAYFGASDARRRELFRDEVATQGDDRPCGGSDE